VIFVAPRIENIIIFVTLFQGIMCFTYCSTWSEKLKALSVTHLKILQCCNLCLCLYLKTRVLEVCNYCTTLCPVWVSSSIKFKFQSLFLHFQEFIYVVKYFVRIQLSFFPPKINFHYVMERTILQCTVLFKIIWAVITRVESLNITLECPASKILLMVYVMYFCLCNWICLVGSSYILIVGNISHEYPTLHFRFSWLWKNWTAIVSIKHWITENPAREIFCPIKIIHLL